MDADQLERRRRVMKRSMALGHCICDPRQGCPCAVFKEQGMCHCAGERMTAIAAGPVRLTEQVRNAGCASKISKGVLQEVLKGLPEVNDPRVLVGASTGDDAGVIMLTKETATILTVDVFSPSVDDPYLFGQVAAANSLSDIYAMGGTPQAALSIIGFPIYHLPAEAMREILRGGADKMKEAGVCIIGGHSINDEETKCGYAVLGTTPQGKFVRNAGAQVGDVLVLTKPLGSGIVAFGKQIGRAGARSVAAVEKSMATLNKVAGEEMVKYGAHAATDVTGFSLLGHLAEIVQHSPDPEQGTGVEVELDFGHIPLFEGVAELAAQEVLPGAVERNRESVAAGMLELAELTVGEQGILWGPETSGGILAVMPEKGAEGYLRELRERGVTEARVIGRVTGLCAGGRIRVVRGSWAKIEAVPGRQESATMTQEKGVENEACCCGQEDARRELMVPTVAPANGPSRLPAAAGGEAFKAYMAAIHAPGALGSKEKKLISIALSVVSKCAPCVQRNAKAARELGASEAEIAEAAALGIAFGGAPCAMFYSNIRGME